MRINKRRAPTLFYGAVPEAQQQALQLVGHAIDNLEYFVDGFEAALALYDFCAKQLKMKKPSNRNLPFRLWQFIAARDGAMTIYHFFEALNALGQSLHECQTLNSNLDPTALKRAKSLFRKHFPNYRQLRNSIGHVAEKATTTRQYSEHGYTGPIQIMGRRRRVDKYIMIDHLERRTFSNTWLGKIESYKINAQTLGNLNAITDVIYDAIEEMNLKVMRL